MTDTVANSRLVDAIVGENVVCVKKRLPSDYIIV
jgi:hypothetical protein